MSTDERKAAPILLRRAVAYSVVQNFQDAVEDLTSYIVVDSLSSLPYWQRGVCRMKQVDIMLSADKKNQDAADMKLVAVLDDFNRAIELNQQCAYLYYDRGNVYAQRGELEKAIEDFDKAIAIDEKLSEAFYNRGLAHLRQKQNDLAIKDLSKAGELGLYKAYGIIKKYCNKK